MFLLRRAGATRNGRRRSSVDLNLGGGIRGRCWVGGAIIARVGRLGGRSALTGSVRLSPSSVVVPAKIENINGTLERGCAGKSIPKKSRLKGGCLV